MRSPGRRTSTGRPALPPAPRLNAVDPRVSRLLFAPQALTPNQFATPPAPATPPAGFRCRALTPRQVAAWARTAASCIRPGNKPQSRQMPPSLSCTGTSGARHRRFTQLKGALPPPPHPHPRPRPRQPAVQPCVDARAAAIQARHAGPCPTQPAPHPCHASIRRLTAPYGPVWPVLGPPPRRTIAPHARRAAPAPFPTPAHSPSLRPAAHQGAAPARQGPARAQGQHLWIDRWGG